jgi:hypothetical protein
MAVDYTVHGVTVRQRGLISVVVLATITLGIYGLIWIHKVNKEMKQMGMALGHKELANSKPGNTVLAFFPGIFIIFPAVIAFHNMGKRFETVQQITGRPNTYDMTLHWLLFLVGGGTWYLYMQSMMNTLWNDLDDQGRMAAAIPAPTA